MKVLGSGCCTRGRQWLKQAVDQPAGSCTAVKTSAARHACPQHSLRRRQTRPNARARFPPAYLGVCIHAAGRHRFRHCQKEQRRHSGQVDQLARVAPHWCCDPSQVDQRLPTPIQILSCVSRRWVAGGEVQMGRAGAALPPWQESPPGKPSRTRWYAGEQGRTGRTNVYHVVLLRFKCVAAVQSVCSSPAGRPNFPPHQQHYHLVSLAPLTLSISIFLGILHPSVHSFNPLKSGLSQEGDLQTTPCRRRHVPYSPVLCGPGGRCLLAVRWVAV